MHTTNYFSTNADATLMAGVAVTDINTACTTGFQIPGVPYACHMGQDISEFKSDIVVETLADLVKLI